MGSEAHATREIFENMVQFGAFWCIFCSDCILKNEYLYYLHKK